MLLNPWACNDHCFGYPSTASGSGNCTSSTTKPDQFPQIFPVQTQMHMIPNIIQNWEDFLPADLVYEVMLQLRHRTLEKDFTQRKCYHVLNHMLNLSDMNPKPYIEMAFDIYCHLWNILSQCDFPHPSNANHGSLSIDYAFLINVLSFNISHIWGATSSLKLLPSTIIVYLPAFSFLTSEGLWILKNVHALCCD